MKKNERPGNGIPISISLQPTLEAENITPQLSVHKQRLLTISSLSVFVAHLFNQPGHQYLFLWKLVNSSFNSGKQFTWQRRNYCPGSWRNYCWADGFIWFQSNTRPWHS